MVRLIFVYIFIIFISFRLFGEEISLQEKMIFNFIDLNNDNNISLNEIKTSISILFQLIDKNQDGNISESEIIELKNILETLS